MDSRIIEQMIKAGIPDAEVIVRGDDGVHFEAEVVSASFAGKSRLDRHRMVYESLGSKMGHEIHALAVQTRAPGED